MIFKAFTLFIGCFSFFLSSTEKVLTKFLQLFAQIQNKVCVSRKLKRATVLQSNYLPLCALRILA